jgi:hypothetical protein
VWIRIYAATVGILGVQFMIVARGSLSTILRGKCCRGEFQEFIGIPVVWKVVTEGRKHVEEENTAEVLWASLS